MKNHYLRSLAFAAMAALMLVSTGCKKDDNKDPKPELKPYFVRVTENGVRDAMPDVLTVKLGDNSQNEVFCPSDGKNLLPYDDDNAITNECLTTTSIRHRKVVPVTIDGKVYSCPAKALRFDARSDAKEGDSEKYSLNYTSADGKITISKTVTVKIVK